jgi:hypothetical protein
MAAPPQHASQLRHCRACGSKGLERFSSRIFSQIDRATSRGMFTAMMLTLSLFALPQYNVLARIVGKSANGTFSTYKTMP